MKYEVGDCANQVLHSFRFKVDSDRLFVAEALPMLEPVLCLVEISLRNDTFCQASVNRKFRFQLREHRSILKCLAEDFFRRARKRDRWYVRLAIEKELYCPIKLINCCINFGDEMFHAF